mmetsp:Transcript_55377/g.88325  ORF Transcript_55377/g.88325 Transcript_55377/m.88325 type:complete len:207 (-) Transcript_55377:1772-2392(-)
MSVVLLCHRPHLKVWMRCQARRAFTKISLDHIIEHIASYVVVNVLHNEIHIDRRFVHEQHPLFEHQITQFLLLQDARNIDKRAARIAHRHRVLIDPRNARYKAIIFLVLRVHVVDHLQRQIGPSLQHNGILLVFGAPLVHQPHRACFVDLVFTGMSADGQILAIRRESDRLTLCVTYTHTESRLLCEKVLLFAASCFLLLIVCQMC